jgi:aryl-alcohol dehydrogenase-like predicted oxidoreductase
VLDAQAAAGQPCAHVLLRGRGDAEALRVLRGGDELVVARARAVEEAAQQRVLGVGVRVGEEIIGRWMVKRGTRDAIVVATKVGSARSATSRPPTCRPSAGAYLDERGERVLAVLDAAAAAHEVPVAAVSLAWLAAQPTVVSPIASARTPGQLAELMAISDLELTADELRALDDASASSAVAQDGGALGQDRDLGGGEDLVV